MFSFWLMSLRILETLVANIITIRNRVDVKLVNDRVKAEKIAAKPNFDHCNFFFFLRI